MLPSISTIESIEMLREDGSLAARFIGANSSRYCLHFQLVSVRGSNGEMVRAGYAKPVVYERLELRDANKIEWQAINEVEVSWAHAKILLRQLRGHLRNDLDSKWLAAMQETAETEGRLPRGIEARMGISRRLHPTT